MSEATTSSTGAAKGRRKPKRTAPKSASPTAATNSGDPGDQTGRNYRYQYAYGVMLLVASKRGLKPYVAIWCEHYEDFLAQRRDAVFDGFQIKTSRPERGAWRLTDAEFINAIGRFVDLVAEFGAAIGDLFFVSNTDFDSVTPQNKNDRRRGRCPGLFLEHLRQCSQSADIKPPFLDSFNELQAACGCDAEQLLVVLRRVNLIVGPSRGEIDASLSHEHIAALEDCRTLSAKELDDFRDKLVAIVHRASSLQVTDPIRHLRPLIESNEIDPALVAKRLLVEDLVVYEALPTSPSAFQFTGDLTLNLGAGVSEEVLNLKLTAGGLADQFDYMRDRALAAEYNLLEDLARRPEAYPDLQLQIEQKVLGEAREAHLRARQQASPYGPAMLIDVQDRLRAMARDESASVGHHAYDCLIGVVGLLTSECRIWWSSRFPIDAEAT